MDRLTNLAARVATYRVLLQLGLLALGLLAVTFAGGAPECSYGPQC